MFETTNQIVYVDDLMEDIWFVKPLLKVSLLVG